MKLSLTFMLSYAVAPSVCGVAKGADHAEPLLRDLVPGLAVVSSLEMPAAHKRLIERKLGEKFLRLTNSVVRVHGRPVQVNATTAADGTNAEAIHKKLAKPYPFCVREGDLLMEMAAVPEDPEGGAVAKERVAEIVKTAGLRPPGNYQLVTCGFFPWLLREPWSLIGPTEQALLMAAAGYEDPVRVIARLVMGLPPFCIVFRGPGSLPCHFALELKRVLSGQEYLMIAHHLRGRFIVAEEGAAAGVVV